LAGYLMQSGFVLIDIQPDLKKTGRNVFFFKNSPQIKSAINKYIVDLIAAFVVEVPTSFAPPRVKYP